MLSKQFVKYLSNNIKHWKYIIGGSSIPFFTYVRYGVTIRNSIVGKYCYIGENTGLNCVEMDNYCSIASNVRIGDMEHSIDDYSTSPRLSNKCEANKRTIIGPDVWIGTQACIRQGIKIGIGAVVGAQAFVNKDVPPYAIVVGSPARILRYRFDDETIARLKATKYWTKTPNEAKRILSKIKLYKT